VQVAVTPHVTADLDRAPRVHHVHGTGRRLGGGPNGALILE
jgi:hypothetical protein